MHLRKNIIAIGLILSAVVFGAFVPQQQGPQQQGGPPQNQEPPKNLKILPKNITRAALDSTMRSFRLALGVRCNFCHASAPATTPGAQPRMDYASDEKKEKVRARGMMTMMMAINKKYFDKKGGITTTAYSVTCASCHNGKQKPITSL